MLEKASSREMFETASSKSAKMTISSSKLGMEAGFTKFSFDSVLLGSKVYHRAFESSWIRDLRTVLKGGDESHDDRPASIMSVSSNSAIASEGDCTSSFKSFDVSGPEPDNISKPPIPEYSDSTHLNRLSRMLETSANSSLEQKGISDLGLAKVHSPSMGLTGPATKGGTEAYRAPELKGHHPGHPLSSAKDILVWSFGCLLAEFAGWLTDGRKELEVVNRSRYGRLLKTLRKMFRSAH